MTRDHPSITRLPDTPGVYLFLGKRREVLYVGKATSLRDRVRSYFGNDLEATRGAHLVRMVETAQRVDVRASDSVLEALILEAKLIKELKPPYNTRDKDDTSFLHVVLTTNETYPRLLTVRGKELATTLAALTEPTTNPTGTPPRASRTRTLPVYGPFPHAAQCREALKILRGIFPYYDTPQPVEMLRARNDRTLRFNEHLGLCPPPDTGPATYRRTVHHLILFFEGKKRQLMRTLEREMLTHARAERFEEAERCKRQLFALRHINDVSLLRRDAERTPTAETCRIEGYDVAHLKGSAMVGVMTVVEHGEVCPAAYRTFNVRTLQSANDTAALREVLGRRLAHPEWPYPTLIVVDGGVAQLNAARAVLKEVGATIPVVAVTKDERHRPRTLLGPVALRREHAATILLVNAEAHRRSLALHRTQRNRHAIRKKIS